MSSQHMTVGELIGALRHYPHELLVWTEGCDCHGVAGSVVLIKGKGTHTFGCDPDTILIKRGEEKW